MSALKIDMNSLLECVQEKLQKEFLKYSLEEENLTRFVQEYEYIIAEDLVDTYRKIMSEIIDLLIDIVK